MNKAMYDKGLEIRRAVLGNGYVDAQLKNVPGNILARGVGAA
jgi:hypothetical protein